MQQEKAANMAGLVTSTCLNEHEVFFFTTNNFTVDC